MTDLTKTLGTLTIDNDDYEDDDHSDYDESGTLTLKRPIDINDLLQGNAVDFEVDVEEHEGQDEKLYFEPNQVYSHLNYNCTVEHDDGLSPFDSLLKNMEDISNGQGLVFKKMIKQGSGLNVPPDAFVTFHYNGFFEYADEPFDSTYLQNKPRRTRLGQDLVPGLDLGISTMKKNEKANFIVRPEMAYLELGCPPRIPPNATVFYEVELLDFVDNTPLEAYERMSEDEKRRVAFAEFIKVIETYRSRGRTQFGHEKSRQAFRTFSKALELLEERHLANEAEETRVNELSLKLALNAAVSANKAGWYNRAITFSRKALELDPDSAKAYLHLGKAKASFHDFGEAETALLKAQKLAPNDRDVRNALIDLNKKREHDRMNDKMLYERMKKAFAAKCEKTEDSSKSNKEKSELREWVTKKLEEFIENKDVVRLPLNENCFDKDELQIVVQIARDMNLEVVVRDDKYVTVSKKTELGET